MRNLPVGCLAMLIILKVHGLNQLSLLTDNIKINEPIHIFLSSFCIHLILTKQPNMITGNGVHPSLHQNCYYRIIIAKVNKEILYPRPYNRLVCDYRNAYIEVIKLAKESFN